CELFCQIISKNPYQEGLKAYNKTGRMSDYAKIVAKKYATDPHYMQKLVQVSELVNKKIS
nr:hypothetical protein [Candidatus Gracilibacteria bacterium]